MRCATCDRLLTDYEATRKDPEGEYLDLCGPCYSAHRQLMVEIEDAPRVVADTLEWD